MSWALELVALALIVALALVRTLWEGARPEVVRFGRDLSVAVLWVRCAVTSRLGSVVILLTHRLFESSARRSSAQVR